MAKRKNLKHMTMAAAAAVLISQCPGIAVEAAPPEKGNWTLLPAASDEFDGTCLNEEKWTNGICDNRSGISSRECVSERWKPRACSKKRGV